MNHSEIPFTKIARHYKTKIISDWLTLIFDKYDILIGMIYKSETLKP